MSVRVIDVILTQMRLKLSLMTGHLQRKWRYW